MIRHLRLHSPLNNSDIIDMIFVISASQFINAFSICTCIGVFNIIINNNNKILATHSLQLNNLQATLFLHLKKICRKMIQRTKLEKTKADQFFHSGPFLLKKLVRGTNTFSDKNFWTKISVTNHSAWQTFAQSKIHASLDAARQCCSQRKVSESTGERLRIP